jgi:hypothetical protein
MDLRNKVMSRVERGIKNEVIKNLMFSDCVEGFKDVSDVFFLG